MPVSIPAYFPNSVQEPFEQTSPVDQYYNCIAWAYGVNNKWLWPSGLPEHFWPPGIAQEETVEAFIELYESIGYVLCTDGQLEIEYEKLAIFEKNGLPTHAARQLPDGNWTSKLGPNIDVSHSINAIVDGIYGIVSVYMKREKADNT